MKLLFVNLSSLKFTVQTPDQSPLGGSESALCYLARALAARGHQISLIANLPETQNFLIETVAHYPVATLKDLAFFAAEKFDAIIICNAPAAAAPLKAAAPSSRILFWAHALPDQPAMQSLALAQTKQAIDAALCVSSWQQSEIERAFGPFRHSAVIGNGIAPAFENMFASPDDLFRSKQNRAAYTTTPYRGLAVLLRAMQGYGGAAQLDIFSSMRVYQADDTDYTLLFAEAAQNPAITLHGSVTQSELARHLRATAFLFYPCIYPETFCITAAEAMAAGLKIVSTALGALSETTAGYASLVPLTSSDGDVLVKDFRAAMQTAEREFAADPLAWAQQAFAQSQYANRVFTWKQRASEWEEQLRALL